MWLKEDPPAVGVPWHSESQAQPPMPMEPMASGLGCQGATQTPPLVPVS